MRTDYSQYINTGSFTNLQRSFQNNIKQIKIISKEILCDLIRYLKPLLNKVETIYNIGIPYYKRCNKMSLCNNFFKSLDMEDRKQKLVSLLSDIINFQIKVNQEI